MGVQALSPFSCPDIALAFSSHGAVSLQPPARCDGCVDLEDRLRRRLKKESFNYIYSSFHAVLTRNNAQEALLPRLHELVSGAGEARGLAVSPGFLRGCR